MNKSESILQHVTRFLLGIVVALVCIVFYQSLVVMNGGNNYERSSVEAFTSSPEIQARNGASQIEKVASFKDDHLISKTDREVNGTTVSNATSTSLDKEPFPGFLPLLQSVATDDKTVIITSTNEAWAKPNSLLDIFLEGFRIGENIEHLLNHLIVVTLDPKAMDHCKVVHRYCYQITVDGKNFTGEKFFMTDDYIDLVWTKVKLQRHILELGYNFVFTDVDILWLRNPFKHITVYADITTSSDMFFGDPDNINNFPNTGFIYVKSTNKTIEMMNNWLDARERFPSDHEQNIFNQIKGDLVDNLKVKVRYIDTEYCGGFCNHGNDLNKICTMHANCCVGLYPKLHDLRKIIEDWKFYMTLSVEERKNGSFTWRVPGFCMH